MRIAFDAKRAFLNRSGLGNYSREVVTGMSKLDSDHSFFVCTPKETGLIAVPMGFNLVLPSGFLSRSFTALWRSHLIVRQMSDLKIDLFHGLSNELPFGLRERGIRSVVTVHDLIFLRYPQYYPVIDRFTYERKTRYACNSADRIIAVSEQTKRDLVELLQVDPTRIDVVYQSCQERFSVMVSLQEKKEIADRYQLPEKFVLAVGTIEPRKNHKQLLRSIALLNDEDVQLVIIGKKTPYFSELQKLVSELGIGNRVHVLSNVTDVHLPAIYQQAEMLVYTSLYEGFGIPILEALKSGIPVIASKGGCLEEVGGSGSCYVDPNDVTALANEINNVLRDRVLRQSMVTEGMLHASKFSSNAMIENTVKVYEKAMLNLQR